jgi:hypothetical protein
MIQGPALLGGVYSSPQTMVRFVELLVMMAEDKAERGRERAGQVVKVEGETLQEIKLGDSPVPVGGGQSVRTPAFSAVIIEGQKEVNLRDHAPRAGEPVLATVTADNNKLVVGEETELTIVLNAEADPLEYEAFVVAPSTVNLQQTEDILLDYTGRAIYGQRAAGGERVQMMAIPFRGSRTMKLRIAGCQKGTSSGLVLVRHFHRPSEIQTIEIPSIEVNLSKEG